MSSIGNVTEIIRFKVLPENANDFVALRKSVDEQVKEINGFLGSELCHLAQEDWIIFIRWTDTESVEAARQITSGLPIINKWISLAKEFVSFEVAKTEYVGER